MSDLYLRMIMLFVLIYFSGLFLVMYLFRHPTAPYIRSGYRPLHPETPLPASASAERTSHWE